MTREELLEAYAKDPSFLFGADLSYANLSGADLSGVDLSGVDLSGADLSGADLSGANLSDADLSDAELIGANLIGANLSGATLSGANLSGATLSGANLSGADLSGSIGLLNPVDYITSKFECDDLGVIVYKSFNRFYQSPKTWVVEPSSIIEEVCNPDRCTTCGSGINVSVFNWQDFSLDCRIWKCRIRWLWLSGVVVPYNTDGKIRCSKLELLEEVNP